MQRVPDAISFMCEGFKTRCCWVGLSRVTDNLSVNSKSILYCICSADLYDNSVWLC